MSNVGLYTAKVNICNVIRTHLRGLAAIALVHYRGTKKYVPYSWINNPEKSNSTPMNNIDAIWRHFSSHTMGKFTDIEGLPHLLHMCCRAGMFITTIYRNNNYYKVPMLDPRGKMGDALPFGMFITAEELWSLHKVPLDELPDTYGSMLPYIYQLLLQFQIENKDTPELNILIEDYHAITTADRLFAAIMHLVNLFCKEYKIMDFVSETEKFDKWEQEFFSNYIC